MDPNEIAKALRGWSEHFSELADSGGKAPKHEQLFSEVAGLMLAAELLLKSAIELLESDLEEGS